MKINIVDKLNHLGLCISRDRLLNVSTALGNSVIEQYEKEGIVCPSSLKFDLFKTAAVDNIDVNSSSLTVTSSLHGTAASLHQLIWKNDTGRDRDVESNFSGGDSLKKLPDQYCLVPPFHLLPSVNKPSTDSPLREGMFWLMQMQNSKPSLHSIM